MTRSRSPRNEDYPHFRTEVVTKPDGRYLIYYSWPDEPPADDGQRAEGSRPEPPPQAPWSPQSSPTDV